MKTLEMFPGLLGALFALAVFVIGMGLFRLLGPGRSESHRSKFGWMDLLALGVGVFCSTIFDGWNRAWLGIARGTGLNWKLALVSGLVFAMTMCTVYCIAGIVRKARRRYL